MVHLFHPKKSNLNPGFLLEQSWSTTKGVKKWKVLLKLIVIFLLSGLKKVEKSVSTAEKREKLSLTAKN